MINVPLFTRSIYSSDIKKELIIKYKKVYYFYVAQKNWLFDEYSSYLKPLDVLNINYSKVEAIKDLQSNLNIRNMENVMIPSKFYDNTWYILITTYHNDYYIIDNYDIFEG